MYILFIKITPLYSCSTRYLRHPYGLALDDRPMRYTHSGQHYPTLRHRYPQCHQTGFCRRVIRAVVDKADERTVRTEVFETVGCRLPTLYQIPPFLSRFPAANFKNYRFTTHGWGDMPPSGREVARLAVTEGARGSRNRDFAVIGS